MNTPKVQEPIEAKMPIYPQDVVKAESLRQIARRARALAESAEGYAAALDAKSWNVRAHELLYLQDRALLTGALTTPLPEDRIAAQVERNRIAQTGTWCGHCGCLKKYCNCGVS